ncbi:uncharacterized protein TNIN_107251 [Trichonephila inaurata madagascariensis]|uniref:Uncharacterized protein n=1 Tax=Trichonephila inaurata madagascariensis TaxID=2747483 RepID=A0A8X6Y2Q4_9ARAC|nr:uncharacterized protein TNIN_107251 [Trichonephila inaurata madagascariensis]
MTVPEVQMKEWLEKELASGQASLLIHSNALRIQIKVFLLLAVAFVVNCSTIPEQPTSSQQPADPTTNPPKDVTEEPLKKPHTHEEHPADNPDHSDHPGHENDPKPVKEAKHHGGDHDHSEKASDGHDHSQHEQPEVKPDIQEETAKIIPVEEVKEIENETQEARFKRGLWRRRFD